MDWTEIAVTALTVVVAPTVAWLIAEYARRLREKARTEEEGELIGHVEYVAKRAVEVVERQTVRWLKRSGEWSDFATEEVRAEATELAKLLLSRRALETARRLYVPEQFDALVDAIVEAYSADVSSSDRPHSFSDDPPRQAEAEPQGRP